MNIPGSLRVEETVPDHFIVYVPSGDNRTARVRRRVRQVATIERRCGRWLWWMHDESAIGLCDTKEDAEEQVIGNIDLSRSPAGFAPLTREEVRSYMRTWCGSNGYDPDSFDPDEFCDYYEQAGWMTSKGVMKDWKMAAIAWVKKGGKRA